MNSSLDVGWQILPRVVGPFSSQAKVAFQLKGKSAGPLRRSEPQRRPLSEYSEPLGAEVRLCGTEGSLCAVFVLRFSLLSPELSPNFY